MRSQAMHRNLGSGTVTAPNGVAMRWLRQSFRWHFPPQPVAVGLRRNDRSLNARQKLLRFGQGQSQVSNIAKTFRPADLYQIGAQAAGITLRRNQPQHPSHPRSPGRLSTRPTVPPVSSYPHSLDTPCQWRSDGPRQRRPSSRSTPVQLDMNLRGIRHCRTLSWHKISPSSRRGETD